MRGSRPVLGGAEGEIPSVYSPLKIRVFFQLLKEVKMGALSGKLYSMSEAMTGITSFYGRLE